MKYPGEDIEKVIVWVWSYGRGLKQESYQHMDDH